MSLLAAIKNSAPVQWLGSFAPSMSNPKPNSPYRDGISSAEVKTTMRELIGTTPTAEEKERQVEELLRKIMALFAEMKKVSPQPLVLNHVAVMAEIRRVRLRMADSYNELQSMIQQDIQNQLVEKEERRKEKRALDEQIIANAHDVKRSGFVLSMASLMQLANAVGQAGSGVHVVSLVITLLVTAERMNNDAITQKLAELVAWGDPVQERIWMSRFKTATNGAAMIAGLATMAGNYRDPRTNENNPIGGAMQWMMSIGGMVQAPATLKRGLDEHNRDKLQAELEGIMDKLKEKGDIGRFLKELEEASERHASIHKDLSHASNQETELVSNLFSRR